MSLIMITEAMRFIEEADAVISMEDKEFVAKYAFRTGDTDLVKKLIEELQEKDADREKVQTKYMQLADNKPEWAEQIENLVIALEMYRIEEDCCKGFRCQRIKDNDSGSKRCYRAGTGSSTDGKSTGVIGEEESQCQKKSEKRSRLLRSHTMELRLQ